MSIIIFFKEFQWVEANAEELPFEDESFDLYTIAFGIRNTTHIDKVSSKSANLIYLNRPFSRIFSKFAKLNPREIFANSQIAKLNLRDFFAKTMILDTDDNKIIFPLYFIIFIILKCFVKICFKTGFAKFLTNILFAK